MTPSQAGQDYHGHWTGLPWALDRTAMGTGQDCHGHWTGLVAGAVVVTVALKTRVNKYRRLTVNIKL